MNTTKWTFIYHLFGATKVNKKERGGEGHICDRMPLMKLDDEQRVSPR